MRCETLKLAKRSFLKDNLARIYYCFCCMARYVAVQRTGYEPSSQLLPAGTRVEGGQLKLLQ